MTPAPRPPCVTDPASYANAVLPLIAQFDSVAGFHSMIAPPYAA